MFHVFIFPTPHQEELLPALLREQPCDAAVVYPGRVPDVDYPAHVLRLAEPAFLDWARQRTEQDHWHCCHELSLYFLARHPELRGQLAFDRRCLQAITKLDMQALLVQLEVPVVPRWRISRGELPDSYPVIVKPNFGFASALVKRIGSREQLREYEDQFAELKRQSLLSACAERHRPERTPELLDEILAEPDLSRCSFLSIPFRVDAGALVTPYPVVGLGCSADETTDFQWTDFAAPAVLSEALSRELARCLGRLARVALAPAVFEAEVLVDEEHERLYVLEFSPRITGGSLPQLIQAATGVPLERQSLELALGRAPRAQGNGVRRCRLERRTQGTPPSGVGRVLQQWDKRVGERRYVDRIYEEGTCRE